MGKRTEMQRLNDSSPAEIRLRVEQATAAETEALRARVDQLERQARAVHAWFHVISWLLVLVAIGFYALPLVGWIVSAVGILTTWVVASRIWKARQSK